MTGSPGANTFVQATGAGAAGSYPFKFGGTTKVSLDNSGTFLEMFLGAPADPAVVIKAVNAVAAGASGQPFDINGANGAAGAGDGGAGGGESVLAGTGAAGAAGFNGGSGGFFQLQAGGGGAKGAGGQDGHGGIAQLFAGIPGGATPDQPSSVQLYSETSVSEDLLVEVVNLGTRRAVSLCQTGDHLGAPGLTATQMPTNSGDGVVFLWAAQVNPSANPSAAGYVLYVDSATKALKGRGSSGTVVTIGAADPHCPVCGNDFMTEHHNEAKDEYLSICLKCLADELGERPYILRKQPKQPESTLEYRGKSKSQEAALEARKARVAPKKIESPA